MTPVWAKTPLKKYDKGKIPRLNNTSFWDLLRGEILMLFLLLLKLDYICHVNLKCAFISSAALYHLASAVGFKKEAEGRRGYCVCVTIPLVAIVMWGVFERAKLASFICYKL